MDRSQLAHYGVLGMKWGVRRARKLEDKIARNRSTGKKDIEEWKEIGKYRGYSKERIQKNIDASKRITQRKEAKYQSKIDKIRKKESNFGGAAARIKKMSTGKALASSMLMGTYGSLKYQQARASGAKRGEAYLSTIGPKFMDNITMGLYGTYESRKKN